MPSEQWGRQTEETGSFVRGLGSAITISPAIWGANQILSFSGQFLFRDLHCKYVQFYWSHVTCQAASVVSLIHAQDC